VTAGQIVVQLDDTQTQARVAQTREAAIALAAQVQAGRTTLGVLKKEVPLAIEPRPLTLENVFVYRILALERQERTRGFAA
jgi:multidrug resistance efflux pump